MSRYNLKSIYLPIPVDTDRIDFRERREANTFISIYGHGGPFNRRSLPEIFLAWSEMQDAPDLTIKAQVRPSECDRYLAPPCVKLEVDNVPEPEDLYLTGDVAIQPSRYEGTGTCLLEAMAAGLPVVTVKGPPMNEIAPELSVEVEEIATIELAGKEIASYTPSVLKLRELVEDLRSTPDVVRTLSHLGRERVNQRYSWNVLRPRWLELLTKQ
jgi:glycosyltransferase involved in cell wall biosynthesis